MKESLRTRLMRWRFNFFPAYRGTGARITYIADDWQEAHIKLPLNRKTRNYIGTIFGGSIYICAVIEKTLYFRKMKKQTKLKTR